MYESVTTLNRVAGEDLRGDVFALLTTENDNGICKVVKTTATAQIAVGVLAEDPTDSMSTDGLGVPMTLLKGQIMVRAGGAVTAGQYLVPSDTVPGTVIGAATIPAGSMAVGIADHSAAAGEVVEALGLMLMGAPAP